MIADQARASISRLAEATPAIPAPPRSRLRFVVWLGLAASLIAALAAGAVELLVEHRRAALEAAEAERVEAVGQGRAAVLETWLEGAARIGRRLTGSELVRLFAAEMAVLGPGAPPPDWLADQRRYIAHQVADFVHQHDLHGVALFGLDGRPFLASAEAPLAGIRALDALIAELGRSGRAFGRIREIEGKALVLDVLLPIPGPQPATSEPGAEVVAALVMMVPASEPLARVLDGLPREGGGAARLVQTGPEGARTIIAPGEGGLQLGAAKAPVADRPGGFALEVPVPGPSWTLEVAPGERGLEADVRGYRGEVFRAAGIAGGGLLLALAGLWWLYEQLHRRDLRRLAAALDERHLIAAGAFEALAQLTCELVAIKSREGRYRYANPALASALGLPAEAIVGRTDGELLGEAAAAALAATDRTALDGRAVLDEAAKLEIAGRTRPLRIFKLPLRDPAREVIGVLVAARDESAEVERERERIELSSHLTRLVAALAAPHASGWLAGIRSRRHYALAVARRLDLPAEERAALDEAACCSRIDLLPDFDAALAVSAPVDPGTPAAAILDVVDTFVATTEGASADATSPGQALYRLAGQPGRFDVRVIAALAAVIEDEAKGAAAPAESVAATVEVGARARRHEHAA